MPQRAAGIRTDPPVSLPMVMAHCPAAVADPEPPLEPPVIRSGFQGLCVGP